MLHSRDKGKQKADDCGQETPEAELTEAERKKRSFERSLAGPSVGKAGLIRDQTEVNRIIAEVSKVGGLGTFM